MGVRPEHILIAIEDTMNSIRAKAGIYEMMGSEAHLYIDVDGSHAIIRIQATDMVFSHIARLKEETIIDLTFWGNEIHLFDAKTGENPIYGGSF